MFVLCLPAVVDGSKKGWIRDAIEEARHAAQMSHTELWLSQGYKEGSVWTRAMRGEPGRSLDLDRMSDLPLRFWWAFLPLFVAGLLKQWLTRSLEDCHVRDAAVAERARLDRLADIGRAEPLRVDLPDQHEERVG